MTDDRHPSAKRTKRREQLQALVERGATDGEREAARRALDALGPDQPQPDDWFAMDRLIRELIRERAERLFVDLESIHEAESHAGKIGTVVVWRADLEAATKLANWDGAQIRTPDGAVRIARRNAGLVHDPDTDRWGVLYKASSFQSR